MYWLLICYDSMAWQHIAKLRDNHPQRCEKRTKAMLHGLTVMIKCQALISLAVYSCRVLHYCFTKSSAESQKYPRYPYHCYSVIRSLPPCLAATCCGLRPLSSAPSMSIPLESRKLRMEGWLCWAARWHGEHPLLSRKLQSAPNHIVTVGK